MQIISKSKKMIKKICFILTFIVFILFYNLKCKECSSFCFWWDYEKFSPYVFFFFLLIFSVTLFSFFFKDKIAKKIYFLFLIFLISNVFYWIYIYNILKTTNYLFNICLVLILIVFIIAYLNQKSNKQEVKIQLKSFIPRKIQESRSNFKGTIKFRRNTIKRVIQPEFTISNLYN